MNPDAELGLPLTGEQIQQVLKCIELGQPFKAMEATFDYIDDREPPPNPHWRPNSILVRIWVPDRDTGERTRLHHMLRVYGPVTSAESVLKLARKALHDLLRHEADEAFLAGGLRVFDPHLSKPPEGDRHDRRADDPRGAR